MVVRRVFVEPAVTMTRVESLQILTPDDWHLHLRDGSMLELTVPHAAVQFGRAIVRPHIRAPDDSLPHGQHDTRRNSQGQGQWHCARG